MISWGGEAAVLRRERDGAFLGVVGVAEIIIHLDTPLDGPASQIYGSLMTLETILVWLVVGLIAGVLAALVVGSGYGLIVNIVIGIVGAFIGGALFRALDVGTPFGGLAGTIFVAFIGACLLLLLLRLLRRGPI